MRHGVLIGREAERGRLQEAVDAARAGRGGLVLLAGEAGVGKTRLALAVLEPAGGLLLQAACAPGAAAYAPVIAALRAARRADPRALEGCGPLRDHLALLLPELGPAAAGGGDAATLVEALRCALTALAAERGLVLLLVDDLQDSDEATLEVLATPLDGLPLLIVGAYRSDEVGRDHPIRRLRAELRRARRLEELAIEPLDTDGTRALAAQALGAAPSPELARVLHDRTQGLPFFVEELGAALAATERLRPGPDGLELDTAPGDG